MSPVLVSEASKAFNLQYKINHPTSINESEKLDFKLIFPNNSKNSH